MAEGLLLLCVLAVPACGRVLPNPWEKGPGQRILFEVDFDETTTGTLVEPDLARLFDSPPWSVGVLDRRVAILAHRGPGMGHYLSVSYPPGKWGAAGGAIWPVDLGGRFEEAWLSYRVRFAPDFRFHRGGKLPGLAGGAANTGGRRPDGRDGWSARMMWRSEGRAVFYLYHPDQPKRYGEDLPWITEGQPVQFVPGRWHAVTHRIVMNTPGRADGQLTGWLDGELVADYEGLRFRDTYDLAIDVLLFSTFFGGSGPDWAPTSQQAADFDDFRIWTSGAGASASKRPSP